jgi:hypothetical protein
MLQLLGQLRLMSVLLQVEAMHGDASKPALLLHPRPQAMEPPPRLHLNSTTTTTLHGQQQQQQQQQQHQHSQRPRGMSDAWRVSPAPARHVQQGGCWR